MTQRLVKAAIEGNECPYTVEELQLARHCTEEEDDAAKIERQVKKSAAAMLLAPRQGETFDGIVTARPGWAARRAYRLPRFISASR